MWALSSITMLLGESFGFHVSLIIDVPEIRNSSDSFTIALPYNGIKRIFSKAINTIKIIQ